MSIIVTVVVPEGIAMAADSRLTGFTRHDNGVVDRYSLSDNSQKLFLLSKTRVGISTCGDALIDKKPIADFLRIFEISILHENDNVEIVANKLFEYMKGFNESIIFHLSGYINDESHVYMVDKMNCTIARNKSDYGANWNGELDAISRLILSQPHTKINFALMPLKDAADLAEFLVELTIKYQRFEERVATCGGSIDVLIMTKDMSQFIKHKIYNP